MTNTTPNERITEFLNRYVKSSDPRYAVMLTGTWGCGKTYFIKRWKEQLEQKIAKNNRYSTLNKPIYVSLFGLSTIQEINEAITREVYPIMKTRIFKLGKKALKAVSSVTLRCDLTDSGNDTALEKANIQLDLVSLFRSEYDEEKESRIIIFDDFERCKVPYVDLLGYINQFVEHSNIRVIILCHEEEIKGEEKEDYARFKEKLIGRTLKIEPDTLAVISDFCKQLGLLQLEENQQRIVREVFEVVGYNNLRSLYQALLDFSSLGLEYNPNNHRQKELFERVLIQYVVAYCEYAASEKVREVATHNTSFKTVFKYYLQDARLTAEDKYIYSKYRGIAGYHPEGWLFDTPMPYILHSIAEGDDISDYLNGLMTESEEGKPIEKRIANYSIMENNVFNSTYEEAVKYTLNPFSDIISIIQIVSTLLVLDMKKIRPYNGLDDCLNNISVIVATPNNQVKLDLWYDYVEADIRDNKNVKMVSFEKSVLNELSVRLSALQEEQIHGLSLINNDNFEETIAKYFSIYGPKDEPAYSLTPIFNLINPTEFSNILLNLSNNNKLRFRKLLLKRYEKKVPKGFTLYSFFEKEIKNLRTISERLEEIATTKTDIDKIAIQELSLAFLVAAGRIDADEYFNRGVLYLEANKIDDAIAAFTEAIKLNPDYTEAYFRRAVSYERTANQYDKAVADYTEVIRLHPDEIEAYSSRARCYEEARQFDKAAADYTEVIRLRPDEIETYYRRAKCYERTHQYDKAAADYAEVIRLRPDEVETYYRRAECYMRDDQYDKAAADYSEVIRLRPDEVETYYRRAECYERDYQYDKAVADYSEVIRLRPNIIESYYERAECYRRLGEFDKAEADYTEAIRRNPDDSGAYRRRADYYHQTKQNDKAEADYAEAIRRNPNDSNAYKSRADYYHQTKQNDKAEADYTEAIRRNPDNLWLHLSKCDFLKEIGRLDEALKVAKIGLEIVQRKNQSWYIEDFENRIKKIEEEIDGQKK